MSETQQATDLFQNHRKELGFVNKAQVEEKDLYTIKVNETVVGAALVNHCVRRPQTTLYDIAVSTDYRNNGIGKRLISKVARDSPHDKIIAKVPQDLPATNFYESTGWELIEQEDGKNRELNVYQKDISGIDLITTGRPDLTQYAGKWGWLRGCRLDALANYDRAGYSPDFIDVHWEDPNRDKLLEKAKEHNPEYIVAGDYDGENYETINNFANQLREFATNVIIVPHKSGEIEKVPKWAVVGYSTPTAYEGTDAPVWEYYNRDVHIMGGTMNNIKLVLDHLGSFVVSLDTNTMHRDATQYGEYWSKTQPTRKKTPGVQNNIREAYKNSILNMTYAFQEWGVIF